MFATMIILLKTIISDTAIILLYKKIVIINFWLFKIYFFTLSSISSRHNSIKLLEYHISNIVGINFWQFF